MKKATIIFGFVFIASISAFTLTNVSNKSDHNYSKTIDYRSDSAKCKNDSTHMKNKDGACCKKDHGSCTKMK